MESLWNEPLTQERKAEMIEKLAGEIHKRRLETPAILFLEMHKPLAGLASQSLVVFSPFLIPFVGIGNIDDYSQLAGDRGAVEALVTRLEELRDTSKGGNNNLDAMA